MNMKIINEDVIPNQNNRCEVIFVLEVIAWKRKR